MYAHIVFRSTDWQTQSLLCAFMLDSCTLVEVWVQADISDLPQLSVSSNRHLVMQDLLWLAVLSVMLQSTYRGATARNYKSWGRRPAESLSVLDSQPLSPRFRMTFQTHLPRCSTRSRDTRYANLLFYILQVCYRQNQVCHMQRNIPHEDKINQQNAQINSGLIYYWSITPTCFGPSVEAIIREFEIL